MVSLTAHGPGRGPPRRSVVLVSVPQGLVLTDLGPPGPPPAFFKLLVSTDLGPVVKVTPCCGSQAAACVALFLQEGDQIPVPLLLCPRGTMRASREMDAQLGAPLAPGRGEEVCLVSCCAPQTNPPPKFTSTWNL